MGARTAALCLLLGSVAALLDLIPPQLFHGCERRSPAIPPHFLHGCGIVFLVLFGICVSLRAGRFLSARSGRLPSSSCSTSSLQQPAIRQPGYGSFVRPVFHKLCLWSAATRGTSEHGDGGGYYMGARTAALCLLLLRSGVAQHRVGIMVRHTGRRVRSADLVLTTKVIPVRLMTKTHQRWVARPLTSPTKNYKKDKTTLNTAAFTRRRLPTLWWRLR